MRNFINIINSGLSEPQIETLNESEMLLEGKQFEAMFNTAEAIGQRFGQNYLLEIVQNCKDAVRQLKRNDRQAWAARLCRLWIFGNLVKWDYGSFVDRDSLTRTTADESNREQDKKNFEVFHNEVTRLDNKYKAEYEKAFGVSWEADAGFTNVFNPRGSADALGFIKNQLLGHYLGIPYAKIQNYIFGKSIKDTVADLKALEEEFKARTKALLPLHEGDQIIIRMPDNFVWVMLDRGYCGEEAKAMGHCGNADAKYGDRILSLRKIKDTIDGVPFFEVFLTFILQQDGFLGEMKGRGNDKPSVKYHDQIITLLRNPIIKGIRGGGYMPGNNFSLGDLPEDVREKLLDEHPHLGNWQSRILKAEKTGTLKEVLPSFLTDLKQTASWLRDAKVEDGKIVAFEWESIDELVEDMSSDDHTKEVAKGDYRVEYHEVDDDSIENLVDELPVQAQIALSKVALKYLEEDGDEDEIEDFDPSSSSDIVRVLKENDDPNYDALKYGVMDGYETGAQSQAHELLVQAIKDFKPTKGQVVFSTYQRDNGETGWTWDSPVKFVMSLSDAASIIDETSNEENDYYDDEPELATFFNGEIKIQQPYYGYTDYDEKYAAESFWERGENTIDDEIETKPEEPDFDTMSIEEVKSWMETLYAKIPDGFVRKVHPDTLPDDRVRASAKGLFKTYYG